MALPAFKPVDISILPPSFDLLQAMQAVQSIKDLDRIVTEGEKMLANWRATSMAKLRIGMAMMERIGDAPLPRATISEIVLPQMDKVIRAADEMLAEYEQPFLDRPGLQLTLARLRTVQGPPGRFIRRQLERVEEIRRKQYNAVLDMRTALEAIRSEYDMDREPVASFSDGKSLGEFLRKTSA